MKSMMHIPMPIQNKINPIKRFIKDTRIDTLLLFYAENGKSFAVCGFAFFYRIV